MSFNPFIRRHARLRSRELILFSLHIAEEDPDLAQTGFKLRHPKTYQTVLAAVREIVNEAGHDF